MTYRLSRVVTFGIQIPSKLGDRMSKRSPLSVVTLVGSIAHAQDDGQGFFGPWSAFAMDVTVVSATKTAQSLEEAPSIMTVITRHDIERWGYDTLGRFEVHRWFLRCR